MRAGWRRSICSSCLNLPTEVTPLLRVALPLTPRAIPTFYDLQSLAGGTMCAASPGAAFVAGRSGRRTNTSLVFHRGRLVHRYDKVHLFRPTGDNRFFSPGRSFGTFTVTLRGRRVRVGVVICYDLRFPELIRALAREGMEILIVPARWPKVRDEAWQTLLKARAMENQIFVLGCNAPGSEGGFSYAFDPTGRRTFSSRGRKGREIDAFTIDLDGLHTARRLHHNLREAVLLRQISFPRRIIPPSGRPSASASRKSAGR